MTEAMITSQNSTQLPAPPSKERLESIIESILFAAGHSISYDVLASTLGISAKEAKAAVTAYAEKYNAPGEIERGVMLLTFDTECQLCTKQENIGYIRDALGIRKNGTLSASSLETLAIIAYNQPVTRAYVDTVRGVDSSYAIGSLVDRGLIESKGRLDAPGRPMLYGTGSEFLRCFGFSSLAELPGADSDEISELFARLKGRIPSGSSDGQLSDALESPDTQQLQSDTKAETAVEG